MRILWVILWDTVCQNIQYRQIHCILKMWTWRFFLAVIAVCVIGLTKKKYSFCWIVYINKMKWRKYLYDSDSCDDMGLFKNVLPIISIFELKPLAVIASKPINIIIQVCYNRRKNLQFNTVIAVLIFKAFLHGTRQTKMYKT